MDGMNNHQERKVRKSEEKKGRSGAGRNRIIRCCIVLCVETGVKIFSRPSRASDPSISKAASHAA